MIKQVIHCFGHFENVHSDQYDLRTGEAASIGLDCRAILVVGEASFESAERIREAVSARFKALGAPVPPMIAMHEQHPNPAPPVLAQVRGTDDVCVLNNAGWSMVQRVIRARTQEEIAQAEAACERVVIKQADYRSRIAQINRELERVQQGLRDTFSPDLSLERLDLLLATFLGSEDLVDPFKAGCQGELLGASMEAYLKRYRIVGATRVTELLRQIGEFTRWLSDEAWREKQAISKRELLQNSARLESLRAWHANRRLEVVCPEQIGMALNRRQLDFYSLVVWLRAIDREDQTGEESVISESKVIEAYGMEKRIPLWSRQEEKLIFGQIYLIIALAETRKAKGELERVLKSNRASRDAIGLKLMELLSVLIDKIKSARRIPETAAWTRIVLPEIKLLAAGLQLILVRSSKQDPREVAELMATLDAIGRNIEAFQN